MDKSRITNNLIVSCGNQTPPTPTLTWTLWISLGLVWVGCDSVALYCALVNYSQRLSSINGFCAV